MDVGSRHADLRAAPDGIRLAAGVHHLGVDTTAGVDKTGAGYHVCLDQLVQLIETDDPPPFIDADPTELEQRYAALPR